MSIHLLFADSGVHRSGRHVAPTQAAGRQRIRVGERAAGEPVRGDRSTTKDAAIGGLHG